MLSYKKRKEMRKSVTFDRLGPLLKKPFFTSKEAKEAGVYAALLGHYVKTGRLIRLGHGIYQASDYQSHSRSFQWEDLIEAVMSIPAGVICLISALTIYGITDEIPRQHWIAVPNTTSVKRGRTIRIVRLRNMELGKTCIELEGNIVAIFDRERTIIDVFRLLGYEIAIKALKMALSKKGSQKLDLIKLQDYAKKLR